MTFTSIGFLIFIPTVLFVFYVIPDRFRKIWLLAASYVFCFMVLPGAAVWMIVVTAVAYVSGILTQFSAHRKHTAGISIGIMAGTLILIRYESMIATSALFWPESIRRLVLPAGISFYMLQAIGYVADIAGGREKAERNIVDFALFMAFFPKLLSGPIERASGLLRQIRDYKWQFDYPLARHGLMLMIWGYFEKIVIADHAGPYVDELFGNYAEHSGYMLMVGAVLYGLQLYADFDGYTHIALGTAELFGIQLTENFRQPYLALSIKDFWRRWHISLSEWLRDYVYIPLGGSRCSGARTRFNTLMTFIVSGIWHGAGIKYIIWGGLHGVYIVMEGLLKPVNGAIIRKFHIDTDCFSHRLLKRAWTFVLADLAWIIFRAGSTRTALCYIKHMVLDFSFSQVMTTSIYSMSQSPVIANMLLFGIGVLVMVDILHECRYSIIGMLEKQNVLFRWLIYIMVTAVIILAAVQMYGAAAGSFIYTQF